MKWLAAILVLCGTSGFGYCIVAEQKRIITLLEQERRMLNILQGEIAHFHRTLPEAFRNVAAKMEDPYKGLLEQVVKRIQLWKGERLTAIWQDEVENMLKAKKIPLILAAALQDLGKEFCYEEYSMQVQAVETAKEVLTEQLQRRKAALEQNRKWIMWLSTMLGILGIIILL